MIGASYTARVICKLCGGGVSIRTEGEPDFGTEKEIDRETVRSAIASGICPVDLPHIQERSDRRRDEARLPRYKVSVFTTRVWICKDCAACITKAFAIDASVVVQALPAPGAPASNVIDMIRKSGGICATCRLPMDDHGFEGPSHATRIVCPQEP